MKKYYKYICVVLFLIILIIIPFLFKDKKYDNYDYEKIIGNSFIVSDDSYIVFNKDKTFYWYKDKNNLNDNYYYGTYTVYRGENAVQYISKNLAIYGLSEEDQYKMIDDINMDNGISYYFNLNLYNEKSVINGISKKMENASYYYGIASENFENFKMINLMSSNSAYFLLDK